MSDTILATANRLLRATPWGHSVNPLYEIRNILDDCLTPEILPHLLEKQGITDFSSKSGETINKKRLYFDLLDYAGEVVMARVAHELSHEEIMLVLNRVRQFMIARGLDEED